jgi:HSP20 family protein
MFWNLGSFDDRLFDDFRRVQHELDEVFGSWPGRSGLRAVARGTYPLTNIGATPEQVDVYVFAAGVDPKSLDISIQQNLLTLAGERSPDQQEGAQYYRKERFEGGFRRVLTLPEDVDPEQVSAEYQDGVLHICIKRRESRQPRQIEVN